MNDKIIFLVSILSLFSLTSSMCYGCANVPAKIASFDHTFNASHKEDVTLPCLAVGVAQPGITWKIKGVSFANDDRIRKLPDGSLFLREVTRNDTGEYSCHVENDFGQDSVTYQLIVSSPPRSPRVTVTATTTSSLTIRIKTSPEDSEQIDGFTIKIKPEFGDWTAIQVENQTKLYTLRNLDCGTRYKLEVTAFNSIGIGDASDILNTRTRGGKPIAPKVKNFIEESTNSIVLHLDAWLDNSCRILYFVIEHRKKGSTKWILAPNNIRSGGNFMLLDLEPATWYQLRVTALNSAGFNVSEYEFATLTVTGGTVAV